MNREGVSLAEIRAAYPALALLAVDAYSPDEEQDDEDEPQRRPRLKALRPRPRRQRRPAMR